MLEGLRQSYAIDEKLLPVAQKLFGISLLMVVTWMNFFGGKFAARFQIVATAAKLLSCTLIILTGFYFLLFRNNGRPTCWPISRGLNLLIGAIHPISEWTHALEEPFILPSSLKAGDLILGLYGGLYAYSGWVRFSLLLRLVIFCVLGYLKLWYAVVRVHLDTLSI